MASFDFAQDRLCPHMENAFRAVQCDSSQVPQPTIASRLPLLLQNIRQHGEDRFTRVIRYDAPVAETADRDAAARIYVPAP